VGLVGTATSNARERTFGYSFIQDSEIATFRATNPKPTDTTTFPLLDISGGIAVSTRLAFGIAFSRVSYRDAAMLEAMVPHPYYLQAPATAAGLSSRFRRTESATHLFMSLAVLQTGRMEWRVSGGPSVFRYSADMVSDIRYSQVATASSEANAITITGQTTESVRGSTVGGHIASEFAYAFSRAIAITAGVRASIGTVTIEREPLTKMSQDIRVGGRRVFLGLRLRLGNTNKK
jgi:hypothetical protein